MICNEARFFSELCDFLRRFDAVFEADMGVSVTTPFLTTLPKYTWLQGIHESSVTVYSMRVSQDLDSYVHLGLGSSAKAEGFRRDAIFHFALARILGTYGVYLRTPGSRGMGPVRIVMDHRHTSRGIELNWETDLVDPKFCEDKIDRLNGAHNHDIQMGLARQLLGVHHLLGA